MENAKPYLFLPLTRAEVASSTVAMAVAVNVDVLTA
jgi:hypothetical protein